MKRAAFPVLLSLVIAGAFLAGSLYHPRTFAGESSTAARKVLFYVDPMHPAYKSAQPGTAPDCGMRLEPVYAGDPMASAGGSANESSAHPGAVNISAEKQQRIGVQVSAVEKTSGTHWLRLFARVAPDETKIYKLVAGMDGLILQYVCDPDATRSREDLQAVIEMAVSLASPAPAPAAGRRLGGRAS
jgi:Cu(I)/Ag(I) efflux system membrane fusion protein